MQYIGDTESTLATDQDMNFDQLIENMLAEDGVLPQSVWRYIVDQARLESNNYSSKLFKTDNNLFGYKYVEGAELQDGPGLLSPEGDYYAHYDSVENSIHEISGWWQRRIAAGFDPSTLNSYGTFADTLETFGYYGSSPIAYAARLAAVDQLVSLQAEGISTQGMSLTTISLGTLAIIGLAGYFLFKH